MPTAGWMRPRSLENRLTRVLRDPMANSVADRPAVRWRTGGLAGETYCLLTSFRANGAPVSTPMWFGVEAERIYLRSESRDAKVARIRRNPDVLIAACTGRGRPTGPPMQGTARVLDAAEDEARAERALRANYGLARRLYGVTRAPLLDAAYIEVQRRCAQR